MLRDLELLLNTVYDREIREYFKEALDCYNVKAYKACIILSVIAGMDDLFKKVESLYPELTKDQKEEIDKIKGLKLNFKPFERKLIEFAGTNYKDSKNQSLAILSKYSAKELEYCFDLRNSFAHPSDEKCTAEKARYVFSVMIDLVSSKKMIGGYIYIKTLIKKISRQFYYPTDDVVEIKSITQDELQFVDDKKFVLLLKELLEGMKEGDIVRKRNFEYFLSILIVKIEDVDKMNESIELFLEDGSVEYSFYKIIHRISPDAFAKFNNKNCSIILKSLIQQEADRETILNIFSEISKLPERLSENLVKEIFGSFQSKAESEIIIFPEMKDFLTKIQQLYPETFLQEKLDSLISYYDNSNVDGICYILSFLLKYDFDEYIDILFQKLLDNITSQTYSISNLAVTEFNKLTTEDLENMSGTKILQLFFSILEAAQKGTYNAKDIIKSFESNDLYHFVEKEIIDCREMFKTLISNKKQIEIYWEKLASINPTSNIGTAFKTYQEMKKDNINKEFENTEW